MFGFIGVGCGVKSMICFYKNNFYFAISAFDILYCHLMIGESAQGKIKITSCKDNQDYFNQKRILLNGQVGT